MKEKRKNFNSELESIEKDQMGILELKNTISEIKN